MKHKHLLQDPKLPKADFSPLKHVLGDLMPQLMPGPRGRQRLTLALTQRFGENFRMNGEAQKAMKHFEDETNKIRSWLVSKGVTNG